MTSIIDKYIKNRNVSDERIDLWLKTKIFIVLPIIPVHTIVINKNFKMINNIFTLQ